ncbi:MAG: biosynthetic arginine decarboxylase [Planctomycetota bacterium]
MDDANAEYGIDLWGDGYFFISERGTVHVSPHRERTGGVDLQALVDRLTDRGLELPILIRFNGILQDRLRRIDDAFQRAITDYGYRNRYRCFFPIKVNQQREVVRQIVAEGVHLGCGIEAGSKPELLAAIAMTSASTPIICNGFKDDEFVRLALTAQKLGRTVFPVIEKESEIDLILRVGETLGVRPRLGIRVKLTTRGSGRWQASGGYRSKFGLTVAKILASTDRLIRAGFGDCLQLLHFHVGSQIGDIRKLKSALLEAGRIYVDLQRRGAAMGYMDVGGGLGIDYDGTRSDSSSSMNYTLQEYANDVVSHIQSVCDEAGVQHPELISESGRAIAAQHGILVVETLGVTRQVADSLPSWARDVDGTTTSAPPGPPTEYESPVHDLWEAYETLGGCLGNVATDRNAPLIRECFHDAQTALDLCMNLFSGGYLPLEQRVAAETLYFALCQRIQDVYENTDELPSELRQLRSMLSDIYFVNFSLFQSLPDAWAIDHQFPIMPIERLDERPNRAAVLADITCDSDGKVDSFVTGRGQRPTLRLHEPRADEAYRLAIFSVGAYQEILGDLHNLFGDTHAVHVDCEGDAVKIRSIVKGDTISEVLSYVQYDDRELMDGIQSSVEQSLESQHISHQEAGRIVSLFERALSGYTYLNRTTDLKDAPREAAVSPLPDSSGPQIR